MSAAEKSARRSAERKQKKIDRANGIKTKKYQVPLRYQGLTTMEYREVLLREEEDHKEWLNERGNSALPQLVREFLKSQVGRDQWLQIHNFASSRPDLADNRLKKLNEYLKQLGLKYPLEIKQGLVDSLLAERKKREQARQAQLDASSKRVGTKKLASSGFNRKIEEELASWKETVSRQSSWANDDEDDIGPLPTW